MTDTQPHPPFSLEETTSALRRTPAVVTSLIAELPPRLWSADEGPGTWTCLDVVRHLVWCEVDDWIPRVRTIRDHGATRPFRPFDREAGSREYDGWPVDRLLAEFARLRTDNLTTIERLSLRAEDLSAEGLHPELGRVTLEQLLSTWATHDFAHLAQLARILTRAHGRHVGPWRAFFSLLRGTT